MGYTGNGTDVGTMIRSSSTGWLSGGDISVNSGDNTLIDLTALVGVKVDSTTVPTIPTEIPIIKDAVVGYDLTTHAPAGELIVIFLSVDENGDIKEDLDPPDAIRRRDRIIIGLVARDDADVIVVPVDTASNFIHNPVSQLQDFLETWGGFSISGNKVSAYSNDLRIKKEAGYYFKNGSNVKNNPKNPHVVPADVRDPISLFNYKLSDGTDITLTATQIDPDIWDDGTDTPATVPDGKFTVQLITQFAEGVVEVFPGTKVYHLLSEAKAALPAIDPDVQKAADSVASINLEFLIVKKGATNLNDETQAEFFSLSKRGALGGIGFQNLNSSGLVFDPGLTDHGDGSVSVGAGIVNLYQTADFTDDLKQFSINEFLRQTGTHTGTDDQAVLTDSTADFPDLVNMTIYNTTDGSSGLITAITATTITATLSGGTDNDWDTNDAYTVKLTDLDTNYIVADYNGGTPHFRNTLNVLEINESNVVPAYTIYRDGNALHTLTWGQVGTGLVNKLHARVVFTDRFGHQTGLALGETGTRTITTTSGIVWVGGTKTSVLGANSSTDITEFWYNVSGVYTKSLVTTYNNTNYDDGTDLQDLLPNRFAVNFVYQGIETDDEHLYYVLGGDDFTITEAVASQPPEILPEVIRSHAMLVGRIIVENGVDLSEQINPPLAYKTKQF